MGELNPADYRALVEDSPLLIWRSGLDGSCDYFNDTWLAFTGRSLIDELGDGWASGVHPEDLERCQRIYRDAFMAREPFEMEYRLRRHDGVYRMLLDRGVPFRRDGSFAGFIGSCLDIQERRDGDLAKASFLGLVAHELRSPLQPLQLYLDMLARQPEKAAQLSEKMTGLLARLVETIDGLGQAARLESGAPLPLELAVHDLRGLARAAIAAHAGADRVELIVDERPCPVRVDRRRLSEVIDHLIDNAIKFSLGRGRVVVRVDAGDLHVTLSVSDEGVGIPPDEIALVKRAYVRGSNVSPGNFPGLGIGLAISDDVVVRHGGRLELDSEESIGTRVTLRLGRAG